MPDDSPANVLAGGDDEFQPHYRYLRALAYRMLGSRAEAEDVVHDAWLRWQAADRSGVDSARAFLSRITTNLCLDRMQSARALREQYVGMWLPEPLVNDDVHPGPDVTTEYAQDVSTAYMLTLERLSPLERAAFLLHDVFDLDFDKIARRLRRSPAAVRQLASRARVRVRSDYTRFEVAAEDSERLMQAFAQALQLGDVDALARTLADDVEFVSDGGGKVCAVPRTLRGAALVAKTLLGFFERADWSSIRAEPAMVNGQCGWLVYEADGMPIQTMALRLDRHGSICAVYVVRNPDKLQHLRRPPPQGV